MGRYYFLALPHVHSTCPRQDTSPRQSVTNSPIDRAYGLSSLSYMNGECVTATTPEQNSPSRMSGRSRRCQGTDKESSGSSINTKNLSVPERYKWLNNETICFSPDDKSASS